VYLPPAKRRPSLSEGEKQSDLGQLIVADSSYQMNVPVGSTNYNAFIVQLSLRHCCQPVTSTPEWSLGTG
jgi:hypothetical protein